MQQLERELERQGWLVRGSEGLELSPKALRRLGQTALRKAGEAAIISEKRPYAVKNVGTTTVHLIEVVKK